MAEFLTTNGSRLTSTKSLLTPGRELVLISPYIKSDDATKDLLKEHDTGYLH